MSPFRYKQIFDHLLKLSIKEYPHHSRFFEQVFTMAKSERKYWPADGFQIYQNMHIMAVSVSDICDNTKLAREMSLLGKDNRSMRKNMFDRKTYQLP
jgi:hypothetical protein